MRPSHKEITKKIQEAKTAATEQRISIVNPAAFASDAHELDYPVEAISEMLLDLFNEIQPGYYVGKRPPQRSYETQINDLELFAFQWASSTLRDEIYLKFAVKGGQLWLVSLHKNRQRKGL